MAEHCALRGWQLHAVSCRTARPRRGLRGSQAENRREPTESLVHAKTEDARLLAPTDGVRIGGPSEAASATLATKKALKPPFVTCTIANNDGHDTSPKHSEVDSGPLPLRSTNVAIHSHTGPRQWSVLVGDSPSLTLRASVPAEPPANGNRHGTSPKPARATNAGGREAGATAA